jgi:NAD(P)-dependent dehydrogenase (short-subunit alcohol dehydrogenase family)
MASLVWLITGCSSGVGEAFVRDAIARADRVIATSRKAKIRLALLKLAKLT